MYILLCGYPPFGGKTDVKILQRVEKGEMDQKIWYGPQLIHNCFVFLKVSTALRVGSGKWLQRLQRT